MKMMKNSNTSPVIEKILDSHTSIVLQDTGVNNPIPTLPNHILIRKPIGGLLKLSQSVPMSPTQMRHLRHSNRHLVAGPSLSAAAASSSLRVRNPVALPYLNVNPLVPNWALGRVGVGYRVGNWGGEELGIFGVVTVVGVGLGGVGKKK